METVFRAKLILTRNFSTGPKWLPAVVVKVHGPLSYQVKLENSRIIRRHVDYWLTRTEYNQPIPDDEIPSAAVLTEGISSAVASEKHTDSSTPDTVTSQPAECCYSQRQHQRKPDKYKT